MGFFCQPRRRTFHRTSCHLIGDSKLQWMQMQGHDLSGAVPKAPGVGDASQLPPDHHVLAGAHLRTGIHIPQNQ
jgi:hypothetical protein